MKTFILAATGAAAMISLAACSAAAQSSASTASAPASAPAATSVPAATTAPAATTPAAPPTASPSATATTATAAGSISIAPPGTMAPGPEKLTFLSCGKLTAAQQQQYGTTASGGLTYRFTNESPTAGAPKVSVDFLDGSTVVASNVSGAGLTPVATGQSGGGEVDAVGDSGQPVTFTSCEVTGYALVQDGSVDPREYAG